jgi:hypothetical protein
MFGMGAASTQMSVGVTVIAPCTIGVPGAQAETPASTPQANKAPLRLSCADGTRPAVSYEALPPPLAESVSSAPGLTRVTISY